MPKIVNIQLKIFNHLSKGGIALYFYLQLN